MPKKKKVPVEILHEAVGLVDDMVDAVGADTKEAEDKVIASVAAFLDTILPLNVLIKGPAGEALEAADGPVIQAGLEKIVEAIKALFHADPVKKAARQAKRAAARAARKA